jgi:hypothetical protein
MSLENFVISDVNPNDTVGGGGCVCSESKVGDCVAPFAIFYAHDTDTPLSPHTVICAKCADAVCRQAAAFDPNAEAIDVDPEPEPTAPQRREPVFNI